MQTMQVGNAASTYTDFDFGSRCAIDLMADSQLSDHARRSGVPPKATEASAASCAAARSRK